MQMLLLHILLLMLLPCSAAATAWAKPGCQDRCGDVDVPYPFGIGDNCSMDPSFSLTCNETTGKPFNGNVEVINISLSNGTARIKNHISRRCYDASGYPLLSDDLDWYISLQDTGLWFSNVENKFTAIGCDTLAYIVGHGVGDFLYQSGCVSMCHNRDSIENGSCSGLGCCQTTIPKELQYYEVELDTINKTSRVSSFSRCSYAVLAETASFNFISSYVTSGAFFIDNNEMVPVVLDWAISNESCNIGKQNQTTYACISNHSTCINARHGHGYLCNCSPGYQGNPYLSNGCQGTSIGILVLLVCSSIIYMAFERKKFKKARQKYFQQHGGWILLTEMKSKMGLAFTVFSEKELAEATDKFNQSRVLGHGGQGTVYKGTLKNNHAVAIKRCRLLDDENRKKEFGKEMLILSEINHKNVVKLLGCCLEVETPMLVYEFIPNGTLFQLIHEKQHEAPFSIVNRLRIAHESAEALAYLHSWASPPIIHGDVKSSNILLDEHYMAKVSDFGASKLAPADEVQFVTMVQGTCGYLDPEYMQTYELSDKSDVYSFGVVLLELLTGKRALCLEGPEEGRSLSSRFLSAMKENRLEEILDNQIKNEEDMELIREVAHLARQCIDMCREKRPSMKEVTEELGRLRRYIQHPWVKHNPEEEILLAESSRTLEPET